MRFLNWSPGALAAVKSTDKRKEITRLFQACFRAAAGNDALIGAALPLDLPTDSQSRYHLIARFTKNNGWVVEAELKHEHRKVMFSV